VHQQKEMTMNVREAKTRREAPLGTPTDLDANAVKDIAGALNALLADMFALYLKTKNFHWHMSGPHFRDYHLLLDEHSEQIFATTDDIAERVRKLGGTTLRSIGHIARLQRPSDGPGSWTWPRASPTENVDGRGPARPRHAHPAWLPGRPSLKIQAGNRGSGA
jgi:starvation-inducible DNA-binding protein